MQKKTYISLTEAFPSVSFSDAVLDFAKRHNLEIELRKNGEPRAFTIPDIESYNDSMQLDSGQEMVSIMGRVDGHPFATSVEVCGDVRVVFRDTVYRCASDMPDALLECYRNGADPELVALSDGKEYETPYYVDYTNWFEWFLIIYDNKEKVLLNESWVVDEPGDIAGLIEGLMECSLYENENKPAAPAPDPMDELRAILKSLKDITKSGWIPFTSPCPSSTEAALKREVNAAIEHLEKATSIDY